MPIAREARRAGRPTSFASSAATGARRDHRCGHLCFRGEGGNRRRWPGRDDPAGVWSARSYSGAFATPDDVDYLAFDVASAGESLRFTVSNTLQSCNSPDLDSCPLYATLMDQTNQQVGGDTSSAGTVATVDDTETIDWTFAQPGTYYLLMESNGNLANGQPTYVVQFGPPPPAGGGGGSGHGGGHGGGGSVGGGSGPIVNSLTVARHQRGNWVAARVALAEPAASVRETLFALHPGGRRTYVASSTRRQLAARRYRLSIRLSAPYRQALMLRHHLSLSLTIHDRDGLGTTTDLCAVGDAHALSGGR